MFRKRLCAFSDAVPAAALLLTPLHQTCRYTCVSWKLTQYLLIFEISQRKLGEWFPGA
jgi:hypothetical protein